MAWFVYILGNDRGQSYAGSTGRDPEVRIAEHNAGLNRWTRPRGPWRLLYFESWETKSEALSRERFLKTGAGRKERQALVAHTPPSSTEQSG